MDGAEEGNVPLAELENRPVPDGSGEHAVTDQGPGLHTAHLTVILEHRYNISIYEIMVVRVKKI